MNRGLADPTPEAALRMMRSAVEDLDRAAGAGPLSDVAPESYVACGDLARELVRLARSSANSDFRELFRVIEQLLAGPPATRNLIIVGMLEAIQNVSLNNDLPLERWDLFLEPRTREAWQALIDMWAGRRSARDFNRFVDGGWSLKVRT